jgi:hypothetical protein
LVDAANIFPETQQRVFMSELDWPSKLIVKGKTYILFSHGYWSGTHYWCKVVRNVGRTPGVWLHNDQENQGNASMVDKDLAAIAGKSPNTSWVFYSRVWTNEEDVFVLQKIGDIAKDHPDTKNQPSFGHLRQQ